MQTIHDNRTILGAFDEITALKMRVSELEKMLQPLMQQIEAVMTSKFSLLEAGHNENKFQSKALGDALQQANSQIVKIEERQHTVAEAQVELRMTLDEATQTLHSFQPPGIGVQSRPTAHNIHTPPEQPSVQAFPMCGPPQSTFAEEQARQSPAFMSSTPMTAPTMPAQPPATQPTKLSELIYAGSSSSDSDSIPAARGGRGDAWSIVAWW